MTDLTTKQLAEAIAEAVLAEHAVGGRRDYVAAVLDVLDVNHCWFCRKTETAQGTKFEQMELLP